MPKPFSTFFIIAIMLISFVSQAMAFSSLLSGEKANEGANDIHISTDNNISTSSKINEHKDTLTACSDLDCCATDCSAINVCESDCVCAASGCLSLIYLSNLIANTDIKSFTETLALTNPTQNQSISSNPYRPPILLS